MTPLDFALSQADSPALEARSITIGMRSQHANLVVVLDAIRDAVKDADWADFSKVSESLDAAYIELGRVYARENDEA